VAAEAGAGAPALESEYSDGVTEVSTPLLIVGGKTLAEGFEEVQPCAHNNPDGAVKGKVGAFLGTAQEAGALRACAALCASRCTHHA